MTLQLTLKSDIRLEVAYGRVIKGKEAQVFGEYFPAIGPVLAEYGPQPQASFAILASNIEGIVPELGSLTSWPNAENYQRLYTDPRFTKFKPLRDNAMDMFSDGHFFNALDKEVTLNTENDYALIIADTNPIGDEPIITLSLASDSPMQTYSGMSMSLHTWSKDAELFLNAASKQGKIFRIRFQAPAS